MSSSEIHQEPFLYITQPKLKPPERKMQVFYSTREEKEEQKENGVFIPSVEKETIAKEQSKEQERPKNYLRPLKTFRNMTIDEKIDYLGDFPPHIPPPTCIFMTEKTEHRGVFQEKVGEEIKIKITDQKEEMIKIDELTDIKMAGFLS